MLEKELFSTKLDGKAVRTQPAESSYTGDGIFTMLQEGEITGCQMLPRGSNSVYLLSLKWHGESARAVYKPRRGEAPLYDFPDGTLYRRECAAYLVSQALKWSLIPPTIIRDGPYGVGMLQRFIATEPATSYERLFEKHLAEFKRIAAFDWLVNNADRKGGHCLEGLDGQLWFIDHGLTFNVVPKLRTVIWDFAGQAVPEDVLADLESLFRRLDNHRSALIAALAELISAEEIQALKERLGMILAERVYTSTFGSYRRVPWPPY
ncbi:MAG: SCO1664 family protein [Chloroflexi bacterium]|nr:SCO1664 family protein [Chloroflexota bacterium]